MALEKRDGRSYYYRKKWVNGRCVSEYVGAGNVAMLIAAKDQIDRRETQEKHEAEMRERRRFEELDDNVKRFMAVMDALTQGVLLAEGYHQHKGTWRRKRAKRN